MTGSLLGKTPSSAGVFRLLDPHMAELDRFLRSQLGAFEPEIRPMVEYCISASGKRIRPALVFLSGWRADARAVPDLVKASAVVELVHLATLVHDDIMDSADLRRSRETAVKQYGPSAAVLLGDALFAHALHLAADFPTTAVCAAVSESTRRVCAGEIIQTLGRASTKLSLKGYYRIIELKTAELFRASCWLGASLSGANPADSQAAAEFGRRLGIAYQIYDDLADFYGSEERIGKTLGTDLASGKLTLPLFVLMERLGDKDRLELTAELENRRSPQVRLRREQMNQHGVFGTVSEAIQVELDQAAQALVQWPSGGESSPLSGLLQMLRDQLDSLKPSS